MINAKQTVITAKAGIQTSFLQKQKTRIGMFTQVFSTTFKLISTALAE